MFSYPYPHPAVAADIAIFTVKQGRLHVVLVRRGEDPFAGMWALPGGFVGMDEDLDACARRELVEETNVEAPFLEQFGVFSAPGRDPRERVISVAYLALIPPEKIRLKAGTDAAEADLFEARAERRLAFDHNMILDKAIEHLRKRLDRGASNDILDMLFGLLPDSFTLNRLLGTYEEVAGQTWEKSHFRKWIGDGGRLIETEDYERGGSHRPAKLYRRAPPLPGAAGAEPNGPPSPARVPGKRSRR